MNATAVETLERRLDATRRALIGEQERLTAAIAQAEHAAGYVRQVEDGIRKSEQIIADLQAALDELRGWTPADGSATVQEARAASRVPPYGVQCPSCGAQIGHLCVSPTGEPVEPHATRGAPS